MRIQLPNGWRPRPYQRPAWDYLERGGRHAELIWHRRSGKDDLALHRTAVAAFERAANYWHMLPEYAQARKAIWLAINPHTQRRRIDEAFPPELRRKTIDDEMIIEFINGSIWQVVGSDSYNRLVGSTPAGVVYSEWALTNPAARAYLRPILAENGGWQIFVTTPRGKNHAFQTFRSASKDSSAFAQLLMASETGVFSDAQLESEHAAYVADYGEDAGHALFMQEYFCSFDAAVLGAFYLREIAKLREERRLTHVAYDPAVPVHSAWDLGRTDDTAIWFFQVVAGEIHVLEFHGSNGKDPNFYIDLIRSREYAYGFHFLPHDARARTLASAGRSIEEMWRAGLSDRGTVRIVPNLSFQDGIQAARQMWPRVWIDTGCEDALELLSQYRREYDDDRQCFRDKAAHDFTSHAADAWRMMAISWREDISPAKEQKERYDTDLTISEIIARNAQRREASA